MTSINRNGSNIQQIAMTPARFANSFLALLILFLGLSCLAQTPGTIVTAAGGGPTNDTPALAVAINMPSRVAVDSAGNIYIAATWQNQVFKVGPDGRLSVLAGNGVAGFSGDNGPAVDAQLYGPSGIAIDTSGNIFIADRDNVRVRKVDVSGIISTVAGNGIFGYNGDGIPAVSAQLAGAPGIAADSAGNLYIADGGNNRIRKVDASGIINTVAGAGTLGFSGDGGAAISAQLAGPQGVAVDTNGNLYIADFGNSCIRKVDASGTITTVAGHGGIQGFGGDGGPATSAYLAGVRDVAVDRAGNLFIPDGWNYRIRKVDISGIITTIVGNGSRGFGGDGGLDSNAQLWSPEGNAIGPMGDLFIADTGNNRIRRVDASGMISTVAGNGMQGFSGDGGLATVAQLQVPKGVTVDASGNFFIADSANNRIRRVETSGIIRTVAGNGTRGNDGDGGPAISAQLNGPNGVAVDTTGNLYIVSIDAQVCCYAAPGRVRKVDSSGVITTVAGGVPARTSTNPLLGNGDGGAATSAYLNGPTSVAVDPFGNLFIAESAGHRVRKVNTLGIITTVAGNGTKGSNGDGGLAIAAQLNSPAGVAVDRDGNLFIAEQGGYRIRKVNTLGIISTVAGNGTYGFNGDGGPAISAQLSSPVGVAVDRVGNLFIADSQNDRIRRVDTAGIISTVAGDGTLGFSGDGGPATSAQLNYPAGVAVDSESNLFIADEISNRIREVFQAGSSPAPPLPGPPIFH